MDSAEAIDRVTRTFAMDREFCNYLLSSEAASVAGRMLVYCHWAREYLPTIQNGLWNAADTRFAENSRKQAKFWTIALLGGVLKDLNLVPYLGLRGVVVEAGSALRRSFESIGVWLTFGVSLRKRRLSVFMIRRSTETLSFERPITFGNGN